MDVLPTDMLLEISKYLNGELMFVNRKSLEAYSQLVKLELNTLDVNTRKLLLGNNDLEKYNHYMSTKVYNRYTSKYRQGLSYLLLAARNGIELTWEELMDNLELALRNLQSLDVSLRKELDLDDLVCYIGYHYSDRIIHDLQQTLHRIQLLLRPINNITDITDNLLYTNYLSNLFYLSMIRKNYIVYSRGRIRGRVPELDLNDPRVLFEIYRYRNESNIKLLLEGLHIEADVIPSMTDERWNYMYSGYYGDVTQAKTLVKGKYAQLMLDYALIGNQPDIVRLCVKEGVNVSRYFDLRPSLVLELKPPNWEFYAIETGDLDVIAKTLESPDSITINKAFGHVDVMKAMNKT